MLRRRPDPDAGLRRPVGTAALNQPRKAAQPRRSGAGLLGIKQGQRVLADGDTSRLKRGRRRIHPLKRIVITETHRRPNAVHDLFGEVANVHFLVAGLRGGDSPGAGASEGT